MSARPGDLESDPELQPKAHEFFLASFGNHPAQFGVIVIGEVQEGSRGAKLFPLKEHGHEWRGEHERCGYLGAALRRLHG